MDDNTEVVQRLCEPEHERAAEAIYEVAGRLMDEPSPRPWREGEPPTWHG
ncbi:hypothetical protein [Actinomadura macra]|nr:hypothetical protein [Actinomadura macra]